MILTKFSLLHVIFFSEESSHNEYIEDKGAPLYFAACSLQLF